MTTEPIIDPRKGDIEADASSTKKRSMLALAGGMLVEISWPKLIIAWALLLVVPGIVLGFIPIATTMWLRAISDNVVSPELGLWTIILLVVALVIAWLGWRPLFRLAETSFWSLNALLVQPGYAACREVLRHFAERVFASNASDTSRAKLRAGAAAVAGILVSAFALAVAAWAWPRAHLFATLEEIDSFTRLAKVALANSLLVVALYLAAAALLWGFADALMPQPETLRAFGVRTGKPRTWRIAHLSDIHIVGERYGFRLESGRLGPRGNVRLKRLLAELDAINIKAPLDVVLISGDVTDAGLASEWAEFFTTIAPYPKLVERMLILPGNHDLNIVDRTNPARMDLPGSPNIRLRQLRMLSAMDAVQGKRVKIIGRRTHKLGKTLDQTLEPHRGVIARFADTGRPFFSKRLDELWARVFPMVLQPDQDDGLGVIVLNSNADTHFSFTNALGMISAEQMRGIEYVAAQNPRAVWVIALHHHVVEYPWKAKTLSERIGTALINGNWFVRKLKPLAHRVVLMHGHRHIDWIGHCGGLTILSAPSPVMEVTDEVAHGFYIHTLAAGSDNELTLLAPEWIEVPGEKPDGQVFAPEHPTMSHARTGKA
ncbi:MAG: metallophosphoesterase family protein [Actinomycetota bacterium]